MKAIERHLAKKNIKQIEAAIKSKSIAQMAEALDINLDDPDWADMHFKEASQIMQVRLANKIKRYKELMGDQE